MATRKAALMSNVTKKNPIYARIAAVLAVFVAAFTFVLITPPL